jgi:hypothetical protein
MTDQDQLEHIAEQAAHKAVSQTFAMLGVDISQQSELNTLRDVLLHARKMQKLSERAGLISFVLLTTAVISGALSFVWRGLSEALRR